MVNRDRWQETEAVSGSAFNDVIRGDDAIPSAVGRRRIRPAATCSTRRSGPIAGLAGWSQLPAAADRHRSLAVMAQCPPDGFCPLDVPGPLGRGQHPARRRRQRHDRRSWRRRHHRRRQVPSACGSVSDDPLATGHRDRQHRPHGARRNHGQLRPRHHRHDPAAGGVRRPGRSGQPRGRAGDRRSQRVAHGRHGLHGLPADCPLPTPDSIGGRTVKLASGTKNCDTAAFLTQDLDRRSDRDLRSVVVVHHRQQHRWQHHRHRHPVGRRSGGGDGAANTLWNIENLRFCVGTNSDNGDCNAFYDLPVTPNARSAAPAIELSVYSLTFASADSGLPPVPGRSR